MHRALSIQGSVVCSRAVCVEHQPHKNSVVYIGLGARSIGHANQRCVDRAVRTEHQPRKAVLCIHGSERTEHQPYTAVLCIGSAARRSTSHTEQRCVYQGCAHGAPATQNSIAYIGLGAWSTIPATQSVYEEGGGRLFAKEHRPHKAALRVGGCAHGAPAMRNRGVNRGLWARSTISTKHNCV